MKVLLLFGLPETGLDLAALAIHAGGASLASDAETGDGRFAVSASLDRLATTINAGFGVAEEPIGPIAAANTALDRSRARIAAELRQHRGVAKRALTKVLPEGGDAPVVIAAGATSAFPAFWLDALRRAGAEPLPVLVHRNPLAIAPLARAARGRLLRHTNFQWHHLALEVLAADPATALLRSPEFDVAALGLGLIDAPGVARPEPHPRDAADLADAPGMAAQSRELAALLDGWRELGEKARVRAVADLRRRFDDAVTVTGSARIATLRAIEEAVAPLTAASRRRAPAVLRPRSPLLFHYHIFKNAGTSVDRMLRANFGERWAEREFSDTPPAQRYQNIRSFLEGQPELQAFSSHTAPLPEPELADREVFPILFVRHPLLRVRSAYRFERGQDATTRGAILAKQTDFRGYVTTFLDEPKARQVRNFQSARFVHGTPGRPAQERERTLATLERLPFVGLVEAYDESVARLGELIRPLFPDFDPVALHENVTNPDAARSTEQQLAALRDELGPDLYDRLAAENAWDLELYERVRARYPGAR